MLKHIILMKLDSAVNQATITAIFNEMQTMSTLVPGIISFSYGRNLESSPYCHTYSIDFINDEFHQAYLRHPAYLAIKERWRPLLAERNSYLCINYPLQ